MVKVEAFHDALCILCILRNKIQSEFCRVMHNSSSYEKKKKPKKQTVVFVNIAGIIVYFEISSAFLLISGNGYTKIKKSSVFYIQFILSKFWTSLIDYSKIQKVQGVILSYLISQLQEISLGNWEVFFLSRLILRYVSQVFLSCDSFVSNKNCFVLVKENSAIFSRPLCLLSIQKQSELLRCHIRGTS